ncbi:MAG: Aliphatic sulfonates import ATP-binding protein SsuB [Firmicutes bacterium]|nr:Aliphatic sulfonates import ATP-binding protein SsuB [candidate division NPL-UPA2 bacterium]
MIEFSGVTKSFGKRTILDSVSFKVEEKQILAILGPSGVGKTTILRMAAGTIKPDAGCVHTDRQRIGFIFQEPRLLPWRTALANVTLVLQNRGLTRDEQVGRAAAILKRLGLQGFEHYYPAHLSGGMRQRVAIARAFVLDPDLALLDEPFTGLDIGLKLSLQQMLLELLAWHPCAMIYVTHEPQDAVLLADRAIVLDGKPGKIVASMDFDRPRGEREPSYIQEQAAKLTAVLTAKK